MHRDYLTIQYQDAATISLPVEQIESLSKYVSADGKEPKINKLNDGRFQKTKQKVSKQVEDIADDLLKLYAERSQLKGFAFHQMMITKGISKMILPMLRQRINCVLSRKLR